MMGGSIFEEVNIFINYKKANVMGKVWKYCTRDDILKKK